MENTEILAIYGTEYKEMTKQLLGGGGSGFPDTGQRMPHWHKTQPGLSLRPFLGSHHSSGDRGGDY